MSQHFPKLLVLVGLVLTTVVNGATASAASPHVSGVGLTVTQGHGSKPAGWWPTGPIAS